MGTDGGRGVFSYFLLGERVGTRSNSSGILYLVLELQRLIHPPGIEIFILSNSLESSFNNVGLRYYIFC